MTHYLKPYTASELAKVVRKRSHEKKIGEVLQAVTQNWENDLITIKAKFVIVGIPEDVGVRANYGIAGASTAVSAAMESFLNMQSNSFLHPEETIVLGEVNVADIMEQAVALDPTKTEDLDALRQLVSQIDDRVTYVVKCIAGAGKIPILIGGGHNNSYGNIKGIFNALNKKINVINCDPHLDFRATEGRHSGNGFSYAFTEGLLNKYAVLAMHEQYNNEYSLHEFSKNKDRLYYQSFESIFVREEVDFKEAMHQCVDFIKQEPCGIELDLDAITHVPSSAKTSCGITPVQARQYIHYCVEHLDARYFHIAEGAPALANPKDDKTGKLIAYLICDFIKAKRK